MTMPKLTSRPMMTEQEAAIFDIVVKKDSSIRASRPKTARMTVKVNDDSFFGYTRYYANEQERLMGEAAYVWRMVAFQVSKNHQHQCMPVMADSYLDGNSQERRERIKELDALVKKIVDCVPMNQWHGVKRWGQAFGVIGQPQYNEEGAIIYR